jgi:uncharacterized protein YjiS (DUF1127 family)
LSCPANAGHPVNASVRCLCRRAIRSKGRLRRDRAELPTHTSGKIDPGDQFVDTVSQCLARCQLALETSIIVSFTSAPSGLVSPSHGLFSGGCGPTGLGCGPDFASSGSFVCAGWRRVGACLRLCGLGRSALRRAFASRLNPVAEMGPRNMYLRVGDSSSSRLGYSSSRSQHRARALVNDICALVAQWRRRGRSRRELASLSIYQRQDIPNNCDIEAEIHKPFWQA